MSISDEDFVAFTTFRKSGEAVSTPTWITALPDGRVGFWTSSASGKLKRIANNPRVTLQPSNQRGKPREGSALLNGTAEVVSSGPEFDAIQRQIRAKHGAMVRISRFFNWVGHIGKGKFPYGDRGVLVTLDE